MTVLLWRGRFQRERMAGLDDAPRPGRQPTYDRAARDRVIALTLEPPPESTTHWSARRMAARTGISVTTILRIWAEANLKPHRIDTFKFSTDPASELPLHSDIGVVDDQIETWFGILSRQPSAWGAFARSRNSSR